MVNTDNQNKIEQMLLGLEVVYPERELLNKLRFFLEKLALHQKADDEIYLDLLELIKHSGDYPILKPLTELLEQTSTSGYIKSFLRFDDYFSYNPLGKNLRVILKFFELPESNEESCFKSFILLLEEQRKQPGYDYCDHLRKIILEKKVFSKIMNIMDFLIFIYDCNKLKQLKKTINHYVNLDTDLQVWKFLELCYPEPLFMNIKSLRAMRPELDLHVAFSKSQMLSKMWLCHSLSRLNLYDEVKKTFVLCGWYGVLPALMFEHLGDDAFEEMRSIDIDENCESVADALNKEQIHKEWKFKSTTGDIYDLDFSNVILTMRDHEKSFEAVMDYSLLINTSCEHLAKFDEWYNSIPEGKLIALQSNNFFDCDEHVNCHESLNAFQKSCPMKEVLFSGELPLEKYTRYMIIGRK